MISHRRRRRPTRSVRGWPLSKARARSMALAMEFGFLLDADRQLLSIGYLVNEGVLDHNCYDLLASEARLASFFAIAKGDVAGEALVPAGPRRNAGRARRRADLVVGVDVRISDALARHARAGRQPARSRQIAWSLAARSITQRSSDCPGAYRNPPTTPATSS